MEKIGVSNDTSTHSFLFRVPDTDIGSKYRDKKVTSTRAPLVTDQFVIFASPGDVPSQPFSKIPTKTLSKSAQIIVMSTIFVCFYFFFIVITVTVVQESLNLACNGTRQTVKSPCRSYRGESRTYSFSAPTTTTTTTMTTATTTKILRRKHSSSIN